MIYEKTKGQIDIGLTAMKISFCIVLIIQYVSVIIVYTSAANIIIIADIPDTYNNFSIVVKFFMDVVLKDNNRYDC